MSANFDFDWTPTFQVQVFGTVDCLTNGLGIDLQSVDIVVVTGDDHVVPLVVVEDPVTVALDDIGAISKVKHIMDVPTEQRT